MINRALPAVLFSLLIGFCIWGCLCWYEKKRRIVIKKKEATAMLAGYILFLLCITVLFRSKGRGNFIDWIPFDTPGGSHLIVLYAVSNVVIFFPVGILLFKVASSVRRNTILIFAMMLSGGIELLQLVFQCGNFQTEDILMNVLGVLIGFEGYRLIKKKWDRRKNE